ncbi:MAG TPA: hypothetical protein VOA64_16850 [Candidatus Dormibacteraeota bacterium]|nr:hypothetical protein [Candidatus Dormibacteraeota bacterium]
MPQPFDIFKIAKDGELVWIEAAQSLDTATARVTALRDGFPGDYMILSQGTGKRIVFTARGGIKRD